MRRARHDLAAVLTFALVAGGLSSGASSGLVTFRRVLAAETETNAPFEK